MDALKLAEEALWLPIHGWEKVYEVSSAGQVRRIGGAVMGQWAKQREGYRRVRLTHLPTGKRFTALVHRLVATAFIPNPLSLPIVNHLDSDPSNNHVLNLEWCTQKHNLRHAHLAGRMPNNHWVGKRSPSAILTDEQVMEIRAKYVPRVKTLSSLAVEFGVSKKTILNAVHGKSFKRLSTIPAPPKEVARGA